MVYLVFLEREGSMRDASTVDRRSHKLTTKATGENRVVNFDTNMVTIDRDARIEKVTSEHISPIKRISTIPIRQAAGKYLHSLTWNPRCTHSIVGNPEGIRSISTDKRRKYTLSRKNV